MKAQISIVLMLAAFRLAVSPSAVAPPAPIKMYRDESRSMQFGIPVWFHVRHSDGLFQTRVMDLIEGELLSKYDVIVIQNHVETIAYSSSELKALREFVADGGGLLLVGNPVTNTRERARYRAGVLAEKPQPLPVQTFSSNQVAGLFGVAMTNAARNEFPEFNRSEALVAGLDLDKLGFKQPLGVLLSKGEVRPLVMAQDNPAVVAMKYQKGRVIVCGTPRLLAVYGTLPERKLGQTDTVIAVQKQLFLKWMQWLAEGSPVRNQLAQDYPDTVPGRVHLTGDQIEIHTIPQLKNKAEHLAAEWAKVWPAMARHVGVSSPLEFIDTENPDEKLHVHLRAAPAGGLSGGTGVSIPAMGGDESLVAILGHEVGHKLLGGCNTSVSEAFACWLGARALMAVGQRDAGQARLKSYIAEFRAVDPSGKMLDIADEKADITQSKACRGKWIWILTELYDKHGEDFIARYLKALRENVHLVNAARKLVDSRRESLSMADHVQALSKAAGEDLMPWFRELGMTVDARASRQRRP